MSLAIKVLTLFPRMVETVLETSILGRAAKSGVVDFRVVDIRDFAVDKHSTVDDTAYGGGAGMIMMAPPIVEAVEANRDSDDSPVWHGSKPFSAGAATTSCPARRWLYHPNSRRC